MYSQQAEEQYILEAVAEIEHGRVLDIGAWNPTDKSNSRALIEKGWDAVLIEPSPGPLRDLLLEYGETANVTIISSALALEPGLIKLHITDDAVSTNNVENFEVWKERGSFLGSIWIPAITIEDIFNRFGEGGFDFVSIDTEGSSVDLALAFFKTEMFPKCYCIEHDRCTDAVLSAGMARGYKMVYWNDTNIVLARP